MKALVVAVTLPFWLPALFAVGSATIAIGLVITVMSHALKDRPSRDNWNLD